MTSTDPISDLLTRIRNAVLIRRPTVTVPYSKAKLSVLQVLESAGWIQQATIDGTAPRQILVVTLKYDDRGQSVIQELRRVSTPGRKIYVGHDRLPIVANNLGMAIISTSKGMMTNREARKRGLGGEIICEVQ